MSEPKTSEVLRALRAHLQVRTHSIRRFNTGMAHYVYEIMTDSEPIVVRMSNPEHWNGIPGGVYWHQRLRDLDVPLPGLLGFDLEAPYPYMLLERLPGQDLGAVYASLTKSEKREIAKEIARVQDNVAALPKAKRYGWLDNYENPAKSYPTWRATLDSGLDEAHQFITQFKIFDAQMVAKVRSASVPYAQYIDSVPPAPFLDDTTTKNVIVHQGNLSGIVDADYICFGDRLYVLALTHMALLSMGEETSYIDVWAEAWKLDEFQLRVINLYTAMHGVYFMSEIGRSFNKGQPLNADEQQIERLNTIIPALIEQT